MQNKTDKCPDNKNVSQREYRPGITPVCNNVKTGYNPVAAWS